MSPGTSRKVEKRFIPWIIYETYSDKIIISMMWIFDTRREFLVQEYIPEFGAMNHEVLLGFQRREEDENSTNRRKINPIDEIRCIRKITG